MDYDLCRLTGIYKQKETEFVDREYLQIVSDDESELESSEEDAIEVGDNSSDDEGSGDEEDSESTETTDSTLNLVTMANGYHGDRCAVILDAQTGKGLEIRMEINTECTHKATHKVVFWITNRTAFDIYRSVMI